MSILILMVVGIVLGLLMPFNIPAAYTSFIAMGLMAACNTLFGGLAAQVKGRFDARTFIIGFFSNAIFATLLTIAGSRLGVDFSLAAIVYFGTRIFNNLAKIQHSLLQKDPDRVKIKEIETNERPGVNGMQNTVTHDADADEEYRKFNGGQHNGL